MSSLSSTPKINKKSILDHDPIDRLEITGHTNNKEVINLLEDCIQTIDPSHTVKIPNKIKRKNKEILLVHPRKFQYVLLEKAKLIFDTPQKRKELNKKLGFNLDHFRLDADIRGKTWILFDILKEVIEKNNVRQKTKKAIITHAQETESELPMWIQAPKSGYPLSLFKKNISESKKGFPDRNLDEKTRNYLDDMISLLTLEYNPLANKSIKSKNKPPTPWNALGRVRKLQALVYYLYEIKTNPKISSNSIYKSNKIDGHFWEKSRSKLTNINELIVRRNLQYPNKQSYQNSENEEKIILTHPKVIRSIRTESNEAWNNESIKPGPGVWIDPLKLADGNYMLRLVFRKSGKTIFDGITHYNSKNMVIKPYDKHAWLESKNATPFEIQNGEICYCGKEKFTSNELEARKEWLATGINADENIEIFPEYYNDVDGTFLVNLAYKGTRYPGSGVIFNANNGQFTSRPKNQGITYTSIPYQLSKNKEGHPIIEYKEKTEEEKKWDEVYNWLSDLNSGRGAWILPPRGQWVKEKCTDYSKCVPNKMMHKFDDTNDIKIQLEVLLGGKVDLATNAKDLKNFIYIRNTSDNVKQRVQKILEQIHTNRNKLFRTENRISEDLSSSLGSDKYRQLGKYHFTSLVEIPKTGYHAGITSEISSDTGHKKWLHYYFGIGLARLF